MQALADVLEKYLQVLEQHGATAPRAIARLGAGDWKATEFPEDVTPFDDLKTYFTRVNGYDPAALTELDLFEPELAWQMRALSLEESLENHEMAGEYPDYWPSGFLPILADSAGSWVVVNCIATSPTYRAVYDMSDGVGCNRIANSLGEFFAASTQEVLQGLRVYAGDDSDTPSRDYNALAAPLFGNSPYFTRERFDSCVVDWHPDSPSPAPRTAPKLPPEVPPNADALRWAEAAGVPPPTERQGYALRISTAPVEHWFFRQSKLKPDTVDLEADIRPDGWTVKLKRKDSLYFVNWESGKPPSASSQQLKYDTLMRWPALERIEDLPSLPKKLEALLGIRFIRYANFNGAGPAKFAENPRLLAWLAPCADKVGSAP
jgi:hypothetical protein